MNHTGSSNRTSARGPDAQNHTPLPDSFKHVVTVLRILHFAARIIFAALNDSMKARPPCPPALASASDCYYLHWFQPSVCNGRVHVLQHQRRLLAHQDMHSNDRRHASRCLRSHFFHKCNGKLSPPALVFNPKTSGLQRLAIIVRRADEACLGTDCPRQRIFQWLTFCFQDVKNRESSTRLHHPRHFARQSRLVLNIHTHMDHVGTFKRTGRKRHL